MRRLSSHIRRQQGISKRPSCNLMQPHASTHVRSIKRKAEEWRSHRCPHIRVQAPPHALWAQSAFLSSTHPYTAQLPSPDTFSLPPLFIICLVGSETLLWPQGLAQHNPATHTRAQAQGPPLLVPTHALDWGRHSSTSTPCMQPSCMHLYEIKNYRHRTSGIGPPTQGYRRPFLGPPRAFALPADEDMTKI